MPHGRELKEIKTRTECKLTHRLWTIHWIIDFSSPNCVHSALSIPIFRFESPQYGVLESTILTSTFAMNSKKKVSFEVEEEPEIHGIRNTNPTEPYRPEITRRECGECRVSAKLRSVHYGKYNEEDAALIIIEFNFINGVRTRYKWGRIRIAFHPLSKNEDKAPVVCTFFPWKIFGKVTEETRDGSSGYTLGLSSPASAPVVASAQLTGSSGNQFVKANRMKIQGTTDTSSKTGRGLNVAEWTLEEDTAQQGGIPQKFVCGVIIKYFGTKFHAETKIQVRTCGKWHQPIDSMNAWLLQAWPWTKDDPVNFDLSQVPKNMELPELINRDLAKVDEEDVKKLLAPLDVDYEVP